jgi:hypothetical protein
LEGAHSDVLVVPKQMPVPILPNKPSDTITFLDIDAEEMARQITLIDFELYRAILPSDFFNKAWTKKDKDVTAPNLMALIKRFNEV